MENHGDIKTLISNLTELLSMIERKTGDKYITAMKQYIVNPLAWFITEDIARAAKPTESTNTANNSAMDAMQRIYQAWQEASSEDFDMVLINVLSEWGAAHHQ